MRPPLVFATLLLMMSALLLAQSAPNPPAAGPLQGQSLSPSTPDSTKVEVISGRKAEYPPAAAQKKLQGRVWLKLHISESGDVDDVDVVSGEPILANAAVDAVKTWKFKPFIKHGRPARVLYKTPVDFAFSEGVKDTPDSGTGPAPNGSGIHEAGSGSDDRIHVSQAVTEGLVVHKVQPIYPDAAKQNHVQGTVVLHAIIDKNGSISELNPISGPKELIAAAVGAVQQWRYRPYLLEGKPVEVETLIHVNFVLRY